MDHPGVGIANQLIRKRYPAGDLSAFNADDVKAECGCVRDAGQEAAGRGIIAEDFAHRCNGEELPAVVNLIARGGWR
jgi:hypothetical protein